MKIAHIALAFVVSVAVAQDCPAGYEPYDGASVVNQTVRWTACGDTYQEPTLECATIQVPRDWTNSSSELLTLPIVRVPANASSANGKSIVYNPGGPGASGIQALIGAGESHLVLTGGEYNIISFDPRGVGLTDPYPCPELEDYPDGYSEPLTTPIGLNASFVYNSQQGDLCASPAYRSYGEVIGTAFVARDVDAIFQALGEDGMIRYRGASYGTLLGSTLAAMFPDKIDRMVLDGNINPTDYYHGLNEESVDNVDAELLQFFRLCAEAGKDYCDFAEDGLTGEQLQAQFDDLYYGLQNGTFVTTATNARGYNLTWKSIQGEVFAALYSPSDWPEIATNLTNYYSSVTRAPRSSKRQTGAFDPFETNPAPMALSGITCGDWDNINANLQDFERYVELYQKRSRFGGTQLISILLGCSTWDINAKEQFDGRFEDINTTTPILFVNGHFDPVTPLVSAQNSSSGFTGSVVLQHNGVGHCSGAHPSLCVQQKVAQYFVTGELPDVTEICEPNRPNPFTGELNPTFNATVRTNSTASSSDARFDTDAFYKAVEDTANWLKKRDDFEYPSVLKEMVKRDQAVNRAAAVEKRQATSTSASPTVSCTPVMNANGTQGASSATSTSGAERSGSMVGFTLLSVVAALVLAF